MFWTFGWCIGHQTWKLDLHYWVLDENLFPH
ncbi:hypothetical protein M8C21_015897 [Ambrosia artemisiifolia]|uniref:Uncharacterized protein n=1 Tax=Ambrosia artemisiifolia TaxID=4212 RepID=A0AAD5GQD1_AMBAR|nr:hypothetical protein M8C21_015897 [Ambrosia artemisiifolia]